MLGATTFIFQTIISTLTFNIHVWREKIIELYLLYLDGEFRFTNVHDNSHIVEVYAQSCPKNYRHIKQSSIKTTLQMVGHRFIQLIQSI